MLSFGLALIIIGFPAVFITVSVSEVCLRRAIFLFQELEPEKWKGLGNSYTLKGPVILGEQQRMHRLITGKRDLPAVHPEVEKAYNRVKMAAHGFALSLFVLLAGIIATAIAWIRP